MELIPAETVKKIDETHDAVIELRTLLIGKNGAPGLCKTAEDHARRISRLELILAFAAGGGGITFAATKLLGG
jgi:hypothetical protein